MKKPELKVVRFQAEDVIATSGYFTLGRELTQASVSETFADDNYYGVSFSGENTATPGSKYGTQKPTSGYYAWYYGNTWYTNKNLGTDQDTGSGDFHYDNRWQSIHNSGSLGD